VTIKRLPFILFAMANLLIGLVAGLSRIGWQFKVPELAVHHGAIMVGGFLGALISLEKAIPLRKYWLLIVPLCCALTPLVAVPGFHQIGLGFLLAGSIGLVLIQLVYLVRFPHDRPTWIMAAGAGCLVTGNSMLISSAFYPLAFPWWMGFVLLTIIGERLELSKFLPVPAWAKRLLLLFLLTFLLGLILPFHNTGKYLSGMAIGLVSLWMLRFDVIQVGLRGSGLVRYSAVALLLANVALLTEGLLLSVLPDSAFSYDTLVHLFFLGFGFSMIFAHGPIILPAVLGLQARPYHPILYIWLAVLHASVALRVAGNTLLHIELRRAAGAMSAFAILAYLLTVAVLAIKARRTV
jgi:hypothetical protein